MSFAEVLQELPSLTVSERQMLVRRALDLDEPGLSPADESLVEKRLAAHRENPAAAVSLETMKSRLRSQFKK
jgi:putative addiction module component (TIGR02574 family)